MNSSNKIWDNKTDLIVRFNSQNFKWAGKLYEQMRNNFWIPQKINLTQDSNDYETLQPVESRAYKGVLGFLVFLDSIQTFNLPHISETVTNCEVKMCLTEQSSQEYLHSQSYQFLIDSVVPSSQREEIYQWHLTDTILKDRCDFISSLYQDYIDRPSLKEKYLVSLIADYILEGVYFYSGFNLFYTLGSRGLMSGTVDMIKLIHRDELTHVVLFQKMLLAAFDEFDVKINHIKKIIYDVFEEAYKTELKWVNHILGDDILGMSSSSNKAYLQYLINLRLAAIGVDPMFEKVANPYKHLDRVADLTHQATSKSNFFESGVTSYVQSSAITDWDF